MIKHKLILGALVAGCLSLGSAIAGDRPVLTDEQKATLDEIRAKLGERREALKGAHDSLCNLNREEIAKRMADHKVAMDKLSEERKAAFEKIKALVDEYRAKIEASTGADKEALAAELKAKLKTLREACTAEQKAAFDAMRKAREADIAAHRAEWEKRIADGKADFESRMKEFEAQRAEWLKSHPDAGAILTPEQIAEMKARFEQCIKDGAPI